MSRYIDAEAIIDILEREIRTGELVSYDDMFDIIERFPTADVEPVRYGEWEEFDGDYGGTPVKGYICNKCNHIFMETYNYCPNCGAKMEEEENDTKRAEKIS